MAKRNKQLKKNKKEKTNKKETKKQKREANINIEEGGLHPIVDTDTPAVGFPAPDTVDTADTPAAEDTPVLEAVVEKLPVEKLPVEKLPVDKLPVDTADTLKAGLHKPLEVAPSWPLAESRHCTTRLLLEFFFDADVHTHKL